jgi:hypothetical protein
MMQDDNQKNLLLAIVLSVAVLLGWQMFYAGPKMKQEQERLQRQQQTQTQQPAGGQGQSSGAPVVQPGGSAPPVPGTAQSSATLVTREAALKTSPRVAIDTPSLKGSIALKAPASTTSCSPSIVSRSTPTARTLCCFRRLSHRIPISQSTAGSGVAARR